MGGVCFALSLCALARGQDRMRERVGAGRCFTRTYATTHTPRAKETGDVSLSGSLYVGHNVSRVLLRLRGGTDHQHRPCRHGFDGVNLTYRCLRR